MNRGARKELMSAMERQIKRCEEPIEHLLRLFFKQKNYCTKERYTLAVIMHHFLELCNPATGICTRVSHFVSYFLLHSLNFE